MRKLINSFRVKGTGKGSSIDFPTINFELDSIPDGIEEGLYASEVMGIDTSLSMITKYKGKYRIETHTLRISPRIEVGNYITLYLYDKLREPSNESDIKQMIENDLILVNNYFNKVKTCMDCQLCYVQDEGYSNYTVMNSYIGCYLDVFPEVENSYDDIIKNNGINCKKRLDGTHWDLDVDGDNERPREGWLASIIRSGKITDVLE